MKDSRLVIGLFSCSVIGLLVLDGCAGLSKQDKDMGTAGLLEPQANLRFTDIPVPVGLNLLPQDSYTFESSGVRVGVLKYRGKANPEQIIIASGGKSQLKDIPDAPTVSEVIKKELIELGIPEERIIEEKNSGNTYQQLEELKKIVREMKLNGIKIISNDWHLPRIKAMIEMFDELKELKKLRKIELAGAEKIVLEYDRETWLEIIREAYKSEGLKKRIELEQKGIKDIKEGKYKMK